MARTPVTFPADETVASSFTVPLSCILRAISGKEGLTYLRTARASVVVCSWESTGIEQKAAVRRSIPNQCFVLRAKGTYQRTLQHRRAAALAVDHFGTPFVVTIGHFCRLRTRYTAAQSKPTVAASHTAKPARFRAIRHPVLSIKLFHFASITHLQLF